jgi:hypothetical protein
VHNFFDNLFVQGIYLQMAFWLALVSGTTTDDGRKNGALLGSSQTN